MDKLDFSKEEKRRAAANRKMLLLQTFPLLICGLIFWAFNFFMNNWLIHYINGCLLMMLVLYFFTERVLIRLIYSMIPIVFLILNMFIFGFIIANDYIFHYEKVSNIILVIIMFSTVSAGIFYEKKRFNDNIPFLIKKNIFNFEKGIIDMDKYIYNPDRKIKEGGKISHFIAKAGPMGSYFIMYILLIPLYLYIKFDYNISFPESKKVLSGLVCLFGSILLLLIFGMILYRFVYFFRWEKMNNRKLFTPIYELLIIQKDKNRNRKL